VQRRLAHTALGSQCAQPLVFAALQVLLRLNSVAGYGKDVPVAVIQLLNALERSFRQLHHAVCLALATSCCTTWRMQQQGGACSSITTSFMLFVSKLVNHLPAALFSQGTQVPVGNNESEGLGCGQLLALAALHRLLSLLKRLLLNEAKALRLAALS